MWTTRHGTVATALVAASEEKVGQIDVKVIVPEPHSPQKLPTEYEKMA